MLARLLLLVAAAWASTTFMACDVDADCDDGIACTTDVCEGTSGYCLIQPNSTVSECQALGCAPKFCVGGNRAGTACARQDDCVEGGGQCMAYQCNGGAYDGSVCAPILIGPTDTMWTSWSPTSSFPFTEIWVFHFCQYGGGQCEPSLCYPGGTMIIDNCNDGNACTVDFCNASEPLGDRCHHTPLVCDDGNDCNGAETCDPELGCQEGTPFMPANCDDGIGCSLDICDLNTSSCQHDYSACQSCSVDSHCDDGSPLTEDFCVTGRCNFTGAPCSELCLPCEEGDACVPLNYSSCMHLSIYCPMPEADDWLWPPLLIFIGLLALLLLCGFWAASSRERRGHQHHHDGRLPNRR
jgi:hypothetical protein